VNLTLSNIPNFTSETDKTIFISRVSNAVNDILSEKYHVQNPKVRATDALPKVHSKPEPENKKQDEAENVSFSIEAREPQYTFDQIVLEDSVLEELQYSIMFENVREKVYTEWGLSKIEPCPKLALNFHGESGTGKTMAAHGIANAMGRKIILASYAEIESKYHGDGPKNVKKLFQIASDTNAVLFIDEADSLLSKRLTNVTQGSEQAINSMRSQLLIQIEQFTGVVIFATNLARNYDNAFVTRIRSINFKNPNFEMRKKLWQIMMLPQLPLDADIDIDKLASIEDICGRDIKNTVVKAAIKTAIDGKTCISQQTLEDTLKSIIESNNEVTGKLTTDEKKEIGEKIKNKLAAAEFKCIENATTQENQGEVRRITQNFQAFLKED
jgi:ATP-dependent 26S proteasome regulatory subunit